MLLSENWVSQVFSLHHGEEKRMKDRNNWPMLEAFNMKKLYVYSITDEKSY